MSSHLVRPMYNIVQSAGNEHRPLPPPPSIRSRLTRQTKSRTSKINPTLTTPSRPPAKGNYNSFFAPKATIRTDKRVPKWVPNSPDSTRPSRTGWAHRWTKPLLVGLHRTTRTENVGLLIRRFRVQVPGGVLHNSSSAAYKRRTVEPSRGSWSHGGHNSSVLNGYTAKSLRQAVYLVRGFVRLGAD